jgi:hypothetical protein
MTATTLSKKAQQQLDRDYAIEQLLTHYVNAGDKVYSILRKVSSSGMTRHYSLVVVDNNFQINDITYYAAHALGWSLIESNGHRAIKVQGCGMDMSFHLVSSLSAVLFHGQARGWDVLKEDKL